MGCVKPILSSDPLEGEALSSCNVDVERIHLGEDILRPPSHSKAVVLKVWVATPPPCGCHLGIGRGSPDSK